MKPLKHILVPTDFSNCAYNAMRFALQFSDKYDSEITIQLLHVVFPEVEPIDFPTFSDNATRQRVEWSEENLQRFAEVSLAQVQEIGPLKRVPNITFTIEIGTNPAASVAKVAKKEEVDLIIMGTQGENSPLERFLGTTASAAISKAAIPIMVIPEKFKLESLLNLAYATDLSTTDPYHIWEVAKFFEPMQLILRVVHIDQAGNEEATQLQMKNLENFFKDQVPTLKISFHDIPGNDVIQGLMDFNESWGIDLMILYRKHRGFFEQLLHHSITKSAVLKSDIPSLVIPD